MKSTINNNPLAMGSLKQQCSIKWHHLF